jgi:hypothetical protein
MSDKKEDGFTCDNCEKFASYEDDMLWQFSVRRVDKVVGLVTDTGFTLCNSCRNANIHLFPVIDLVGIELKKETI